MKPDETRKFGWTLRSVLLATGVSLAGLMIALQLYKWGLWPDIEWSVLVVPAVVGTVFLVIRHPGTGLLSALLFFPLLVALMFYAGACFPLS